ncbi:MAG: hypothetical protein AVDCRST_MAG74-1764 [uncultured Pyrinomonadaceae bacterium]|uniref:CsbD-like domain-containing protein n=1 Tax=uncultured Pyrinomonadaceae bacterium TaxID=2283094 RepID=A0A6J4P0S5_9BACT|nr:MAG: hypothetical protein AVDCRST_MAG74-1764 [uncultured Pyrinomonadaceae bacterium]
MKSSVEFVLERYTKFFKKETYFMSIPNNDEVEGKAENIGGKIKEGVGNLTGDRSLEAEGEADQAEGQTQETWGKFKRGVGDTIDAVGDAISNTGKDVSR